MELFWGVVLASLIATSILGVVLMLPVIVFVTITLSFGIIKTTYDNSSNIRMLLTETSIQLEAIANS